MRHPHHKVDDPVDDSIYFFGSRSCSDTYEHGDDRTDQGSYDAHCHTDGQSF